LNITLQKAVLHHRACIEHTEHWAKINNNRYYFRNG